MCLLAFAALQSNLKLDSLRQPPFYLAHDSAWQLILFGLDFAPVFVVSWQDIWSISGRWLRWAEVIELGHMSHPFRRPAQACSYADWVQK